jgi:hypothetical protein
MELLPQYTEKGEQEARDGSQIMGILQIPPK